ncbi:YesL family protein [Ferdinandcohnia sp. Marseille-Q9671]
MTDNRLLNTLNSIVDYFLLNLLWVIASIPLLTIFPATAAMFGVIRKRQLQKDSKGIFLDFLMMFKENFKQSSILSIIWAVVALFLYMDYMLIDPQGSVVELVLYIFLISAVILFSAITILVFPVMVHFTVTWKGVIRNSFFFSLMKPIVSIVLLVSLVVGLGSTYYYPISIFIVPSVIVSIVYSFSQKLFDLVQE